MSYCAHPFDAAVSCEGVLVLDPKRLTVLFGPVRTGRAGEHLQLEVESVVVWRCRCGLRLPLPGCQLPAWATGEDFC